MYERAYVVSLYVMTKNGFKKVRDVKRCYSERTAELETIRRNDDLGVRQDSDGWYITLPGTRFYMYE